MSSPAVHIGICPVSAVVARLASNRTGPDRGGHRDPPAHSRRQQLAVLRRLDSGEPPDPGPPRPPPAPRPRGGGGGGPPRRGGGARRPGPGPADVPTWTSPVTGRPRSTVRTRHHGTTRNEWGRDSSSGGESRPRHEGV